MKQQSQINDTLNVFNENWVRNNALSMPNENFFDEKRQFVLSP